MDAGGRASLSLDMDAPYRFLAETQKSLLVSVAWSEPDSDGLMSFLAPLAVNGVTFGGLTLRGNCYRDYPDSATMFQLEVERPGVRTRWPLLRLEWRPLNEPHKNPDKTLIFGTHFHPFDPNWVEGNQAMRSRNLPWAVEIAPDLATYSEVIDFVANRFNIKGLDRLQPPRWIGRLL